MSLVRPMVFFAICCAVMAEMFAMASQVRGDLIIEVQDASVNPGGEGFVDVTIRTDSGAMNLDDFSIELGITGATTHGVLQYSLTQLSDVEMAAVADYVFSTSNLPGGFSSFYNVVTPDAVTGVAADFMISSGTGVTITTASALLARFKVTHTFSGTAAESLGDTYTLTVTNPSGNTYFNDNNGNPLAFTVGRAGLLTVTPEPSLALTGSVAGCLMAFWLRRRQLKATG